jgi:hypothetical protein
MIGPIPPLSSNRSVSPESMCTPWPIVQNRPKKSKRGSVCETVARRR